MPHINKHVAMTILLFAVPLAFVWMSCQRGSNKELTVAIALLPSEQAKYAKILDEFTNRTGIRVNLVAQQYQQIREAVEAEAKAGGGQLDVVELDVYFLPLLYRVFQPLDSLVNTRMDMRAQVQKEAWDVGVFGSNPSQTLFVPHRLNWQALFYDVTVLKHPPATWAELLSVAKAHPGKIGIKGARYEGMVTDLFPFVWQSGGNILEPASAASLRALEFLKKLAPTLNHAAQSYKENSILQAQEQLEIILHFNWPFAVPLLREKGLLHTRVETAPLPEGPAGRATVLGGGYLGIPSTAPHPREAAALIEFITSDSTQRVLTRELGWFPVRTSGWDELTSQDKKDFAGFIAMREHVRARPNIPTYEQVSQIWQDGFARILFEGGSPAGVANEMQRRIDALHTLAGR